MEERFTVWLHPPNSSPIMITTLPNNSRLHTELNAPKRGDSHSEAVKLGKYIDEVNGTRYRLKSTFSSWRLSIKHNLAAQKRTDLVSNIEELLELALCINATSHVALTPPTTTKSKSIERNDINVVLPQTEEVIIDGAGIPHNTGGGGGVEKGGVNSDRKSSNQPKLNGIATVVKSNNIPNTHGVAATSRVKRNTARSNAKKGSTTSTEKKKKSYTNGLEKATASTKNEERRDNSKKTSKNRETNDVEVKNKKNKNQKHMTVAVKRGCRDSVQAVAESKVKRRRTPEIGSKNMESVKTTKKNSNHNNAERRRRKPTPLEKFVAEASKNKRFVDEEEVLDGGEGDTYKSISTGKKKRSATLAKDCKRLARNGGIREKVKNDKKNKKNKLSIDTRHNTISKPRSFKNLTTHQRRAYHKKMEYILSKARRNQAMKAAKEAATRAQHAGDRYKLACLDIGVRMISTRYSSGAAHPKKRLAFERDLKAFMEDRGDRQRTRTIRGKEVELYSLFVAVVRGGGYENVIRRNKLREMLRNLGYDVSKSQNAKLRPVYVNELFAYETMLVHGRSVTRDELRQMLLRNPELQATGGVSKIRKRSSTRLSKVVD